MSSKNYDDIWRDQNIQELFTVPDPNVIELIATIHQDKKDTKVLDVGFGLGRHIILFAKEGFETSGIEFSESGFNYCKLWLEREGLSAVIRLGKMTSLPYENNTFHLVLAWHVLYHGKLRQIIKAIDEIHRVTRKNGLAYVTLTSTRDKHYREGKEIEPNTFLNPNKGFDGDLPHHYSDEKEVRSLFKRWKIKKLKEIGYSLAGRTDKESIRWMILAEKN
jgi:ubiquinone/menaquinone biosynthesis C-methylase UbiE